MKPVPFCCNDLQSKLDFEGMKERRGRGGVEGGQ